LRLRLRLGFCLGPRLGVRFRFALRLFVGLAPRLLFGVLALGLGLGQRLVGLSFGLGFGVCLATCLFLGLPRRGCLCFRFALDFFVRQLLGGGIGGRLGRCVLFGLAQDSDLRCGPALRRFLEGTRGDSRRLFAALGFLPLSSLESGLEPGQLFFRLLT